MTADRRTVCVTGRGRGAVPPRWLAGFAIGVTLGPSIESEPLMTSSRPWLPATLLTVGCLAAAAQGAPPTAVAVPWVHSATPAGSAPASPAGPGRYIVRTTSATAAGAQVASLRAAGAAVRVRYRHVLNGYAGTFSAEQVRRLRADSSVASVRPDVAMSVDSTQTDPTWGLDRIDQRALPRDHAVHYDTTGQGVTAFVIDSGIRFSHDDFGGRAVLGHDYVVPSTGGTDCAGHGTHVAGTIGGTTYGVAKQVKLVSLRMFDCDGNGYSSDLIAALDWAVAHKPAGGSVVNFSGGGPADPDSDTAVRNTVRAGISVVVAAGNDHEPACNTSPGRVPEALTVAASDVNDREATFTDFGSCVDLFAPGVSITSDGIASDTATQVMSGTSMAAPHVSGAIARYLQVHPEATPATVSAAVLAAATSGALQLVDPGPNVLLYSGQAASKYAPTRVVTRRSPPPPPGNTPSGP